jgi:hypothetical protein
MAPQVLLPALGPLLQPAGARHLLAALLHGASALLARAARQLVGPQRAAVVEPPQLEFHADAGAPEGALYADGVLVALLPGVNRL